MSDKIPFAKMHSAGNDFIIIDNREDYWSFSPDAVCRLAQRRTGIGFDQLMLIDPLDDDNRPTLRIFNQDGGPAEACGNGTRCAAHWLMRQSGETAIDFSGPVGILTCRQLGTDEDATPVIATGMGRVGFDYQQIPLTESCDTRALPITFDPDTAPFAYQCAPPVAVNIGNPHCVLFCDNADESRPEIEGHAIEHHPLFPQRCNVEFVSVNHDGSLRMRVWERGVGVTPACGSGACAAFAAAKRTGRLDAGRADIIVDGGRLSVEWPDAESEIILSGAVHHIYDGILT